MSNIYEELKQQLGWDMQYLEELAETDPEFARELVKAALIRTGVLNEDGSRKEHIVDESHVGFDESNMSYSEIVATMKKCRDSFKKLGDDDHDKIHELMCQALLDSKFIDKNGHIIVPEKRSPQVEDFFRRVEKEIHNSNSKQRVRK